jgi:hypothetical protein
MRKTVILILAGLLCGMCATSTTRAEYVESFENNINSAGWFYTTNPIRINQIEPTGGHPGAWFHGTANAGAPTVQTMPGIASAFTGDYASRGVSRVGVDIEVLNGDNDHRGFTLALTDFADGDINNLIVAYTSLRPIPNSGSGWRPYLFNVPATSGRIPSTWSMFRGDGAAPTDADWQALMSHVDQVAFMWGEFGFAYPLHTVWDLGIDNVRITGTAATLAASGDSLGADSTVSLVPEPAALAVFSLAGLTIGRRRRA